MTCQTRGRCPIGIIGFGRASECSRSLMPIPPQNRTTFTVAAPFRLNVELPTTRDCLPPRSWVYVNLGNGNDETAAPLANIGKLIHYFGLQVPGQNQHVVRLRLPDSVRRKNGNVRTRKELVMLIRIEVDGIVQKIRPDPAVI